MNGIAGLYGKVMFNIIRVAVLFLHPHKQCICILITSSPQYSIVSFLIVVLLLFVCFVVLSCSNRYFSLHNHCSYFLHSIVLTM